MKYITRSISRWTAATLLMLPLSATSQQADILWAINDAPPFHVISGPQKNQGFCDQLVEQIENALPDTTQRRVILPHMRIRQQLAQKQPLCFPCMIKRPDNSNTLFSGITNQYPPHVLITTPQKAAAITYRYGNPVHLTSLIADKHFIFGRPAGRQYYQPLDPIIDNLGHPNWFIERKGTGGTPKIIHMLQLGRVDYTIDYRMVATFYQHQHQDIQLTELAIAENQHSPINGAIGCTNSPWGKKAIHLIDTALQKIKTTSRYQQLSHFWFPPASSQFSASNQTAGEIASSQQSTQRASLSALGKGKG